MDIAILGHAKSEPYRSLQERYEKVDEIPFDFNRRRMSVVIRDHDGKTQLITKGAVEEMLSISAFTEYNGKVVNLTDELRGEILSTVERLNGEGMRVLAVAQKTNPSVEGVFSVKDESSMKMKEKSGETMEIRINYEDKATVLKALSNPVRLQIVHGLLLAGCRNVSCMPASRR